MPAFFLGIFEFIKANVFVSVVVSVTVGAAVAGGVVVINNNINAKNDKNQSSYGGIACQQPKRVEKGKCVSN